jgi:hypothetical protein
MLTPDNQIKPAHFGSHLEGKKRNLPTPPQSDETFEQLLDSSDDEKLASEIEIPELMGYVPNNIFTLSSQKQMSPQQGPGFLAQQSIFEESVPQEGVGMLNLSITSQQEPNGRGFGAGGKPISANKEGFVQAPPPFNPVTSQEQLAARLNGETFGDEEPEVVETPLVIPSELLGGIEKLLKGTGQINTEPLVAALGKPVAAPLTTALATTSEPLVAALGTPIAGPLPTAFETPIARPLPTPLATTSGPLPTVLGTPVAGPLLTELEAAVGPLPTPLETPVAGPLSTALERSTAGLLGKVLEAPVTGPLVSALETPAIPQNLGSAPLKGAKGYQGVLPSNKSFENNNKNKNSVLDNSTFVNKENVMLTPNNSNLSNSNLKADVQLGSSTSQSSSKPAPSAPPPNARAAFKKILDNSKGVDKEEGSEAEEKPAAPSSIFEMSGTNGVGKAKGEPVANGLNGGEQISSLIGATGTLAGGVSATTGKGKGSSTTSQKEGQPNLASISPVAAVNMETATPITPETSQTTRAPTLQNLIDLIVDKVYTLETSGKTDTVLVLANPPLLAGSSVVITAFDSAKGQFNIAFYDLNSQAQQLINANQQGLRQGLEEKGYFVHIVVISTNPIEAPSLGASTPDQSRSGQQQEREQERQQEQDPEDG